ncbi:hypothetical protein EYC84_010506 [Monilinia fructicola]|uniref:Uncharacterized protein n=1 Tax=Monilinia fructicola TaxID=38448 RepID=A0A5M9JD03_MONFR|nr:hypothetical protein EYC84_010506 [Monilinia fructicola]
MYAEQYLNSSSAMIRYTEDEIMKISTGLYSKTSKCKEFDQGSDGSRTGRGNLPMTSLIYEYVHGYSVSATFVNVRR